MSRKQFLLILFIAVPLIINAGWTSTDEKFSILGMGAKSSALNNAFCAVADDYSATFWNPAGMSYINSINIGGMYNKLSLNRNVNYAALVFSLSRKSTIGISWANLKIDDIEARQGNTPEPDYYFANTERMIWISYSRYLLSNLTFGLNMKYYQNKLNDCNAFGGGIDFGILMKMFDGFRIGFVSKDLGARIKWDTGKSEQFERSDRLGLSFSKIQNFLIAVDYSNKKQWSIGTEIRVGGIFKLRSGFQDNIWAFGTGLILPVFMNNFVLINYSIKSDPFTNTISHLMDFNLQLF